MGEKTKWWVEFGLDVLATWLIGWVVVGGIVFAMLSPNAKDADALAYLIPYAARGAITYAAWKLFRTFNWLKGVPAKLS